MKTLATILLAGALSATAAFAGALPRNDKVAEKAVPQLPFRLYQKRPVATQQVAGAPARNIGVPQLPSRLYQKRPTGAAGAERRLSTVEAANLVQ